MQSKTIIEAIEIYIRWKRRRIRSADKIYKNRLMNFGEYIGLEKELPTLTGDDIVAFHEQMERDGYSVATVAHSTRIIRNFISFWKGREQTKIEPKEIQHQLFITPEQVVTEREDFELMSELLSEYHTKELQQKLILHMLWDTGMRVSELAGLKLENISNKTVNGIRTAQIRTLKTDIYNLVLWSAETDRLLDLYLAWRLGQDHPTDYLFIRTDRMSKNPLSTRTVERWIKQLKSDAMIDKNITPHSFRHGKAHDILNRGGTAIDVQTVLRHKNFNSSLHYMRLNQAKYIERAGKFLQNKEKKELTPEATMTQLSSNLNYINELVAKTNLVYNN